MKSRFFACVLGCAMALWCEATSHPQPSKGIEVEQSWIANSFSRTNGGDLNGPLEWVPDFLNDLCVAPDGTVFTAGAAEYGGGGASFKNGAWRGRYGAYGSEWGEPTASVATDGAHVYFASNDGVRRFPFGGSRQPTGEVARGSFVKGVATRNGKLFVSDYSGNKIRVFALATLRELRSWPMERPGKLAVDRAGRVWAIRNAEGREQDHRDHILRHGPRGDAVLSFAPDGTPGATLQLTNPTDLAVDPQGRLLVACDDANNQVLLFDVSKTPKRVGAFGERGGIWSGVAGRFTARPRFARLKGVDVDAQGNIYVACRYADWGQTVEAFRADGTRLWRVSGHSWVNGGDFDPASENTIYDGRYRYTLDYSKPAGQQWTVSAVTLNARKYPDDWRRNFALVHSARRMDGQLFLFMTDQRDEHFAIYRFNAATDGDVAIPCGAIRRDALWLDTNGNGREDARETVPKEPTQALFVSGDGDLWLHGERAWLELSCEGVAASGHPIYNPHKAARWNDPPEFSKMYQAFYDEERDVMWLAGNQPWRGNDSIRRLVRYDGWKSPSRRIAWDVDLPTDVQRGFGGGLNKTLRVTGDYVFIAIGTTDTRVHERATGAYVGTIYPNVNGAAGHDGALDAHYGMNARQKRDGAYVTLLEEAGWNRLTMPIWKPATQAPLPPRDLSASARNGGIALRWNANDARSYTFVVERAQTQNGPFAPVESELDAPRWFDASAFGGESWYRLRARNNRGQSAPSRAVRAVWNGEADLFDAPFAAFTTQGSREGPEGEQMAWDNDPRTKWLEGAPQTWLQLDGGGPRRRVIRYTLTSANDIPERDPRDWQLQGSDDGQTWTTLDARTGELFASRGQARSFEVSAASSHRLHRLLITANNGAGETQLAEVELLYNAREPGEKGVEHGVDRTDEPGVAISKNSASGDEGREQAFDNSPYSKWLEPGAQGWIGWRFEQARVVNHLRLTSASDAPERDPKSWTLQGSDNGEAWTALDARSNVQWSRRLQTQGFSFGNATPFRFYRLNISANHGADLTQIAEIGLLEFSPSVRRLAPPAVTVSRSPSGAHLVTMTPSSTTPAAQLRYSLDGVEPQAHDRQYTNPLQFAGARELRVRAFAPGFAPSEATLHLLP